MKLTQYSLALVTLASLGQTAVITTTLSPAEQTNAAVVAQQDALGNIVQGIFLTTSLMNFLNNQYPPELLKFMASIYNYDGSDFPTSIFVDSFPFSEFESVFNAAPWKDTFLAEQGISTINDPSYYAVMTITGDSTESATSETETPSATSTTIPETSTAETSSETPTSSESSTSETTTAETTTEVPTTSSEETTLITSSTSSAAPTPIISEYSDSGASSMAIPGAIALFAIAFL